MPVAVIILQPRIRPFGTGALLVTLHLAWREFDLLSTARVVADQRHMPQAAAVLAQHAAAIGRIHQIVAVRHPLHRHQRQRYHRQNVVHRGAGKQRAHQYAAVRRINVQLVAVPTILVALRVALAAPVAVSRQFLQESRQGLVLLPLTLSRLRLANFAFPETTRFFTAAGASTFFAGFSRASITVPSRLIWPTST